MPVIVGLLLCLIIFAFSVWCFRMIVRAAYDFKCYWSIR